MEANLPPQQPWLNLLAPVRLKYRNGVKKEHEGISQCPVSESQQPNEVRTG